MTVTGRYNLGRWVLHYAGATDTGRYRPENEDAFIVKPEQGLFIVSDGMGGHTAGGTASRLVIETLPQIIAELNQKTRSSNPRTIRKLIHKSLILLDQHVRKEGSSGNGNRYMGATLALAIFTDSRTYIANVGDSRIYRLRNKKLKQLSIDHTVVAELIENGDIEPAQAENHPQQHIVTQCIGYDILTETNVKSFQPRCYDRILLCTDGLTDAINDSQIASILNEYQQPQQACEALIKAANDANSSDNITAVAIYQNT